MTSTSTGPLPALYSRTLTNASKAATQTTIDDETQQLIQSVLTDLKEVDSRINALSLFSTNDVLEDISTKDLVYLTVPFVLFEVENRIRISDRNERIAHLFQVQRHLETFISSLESYGVVSDTEHTLHTQPSPIKDAAKRREMKIKQYMAEKDLRARIETVQRRRRQQPPEGLLSNDFDLVRSLLPSVSASSSSDDEEDPEMDDILREASLLSLRLLYIHACSQLQSLSQELELLRNTPTLPPVSPPADEWRETDKDQEAMWRLDLTTRMTGRGPLLDPTGKPLQPFTILPRGAMDRSHLKAQVFSPGHRLPTMTVDEYLEIERQRGNILTGGGRQLEEKPTTSEQLAIDSEMDRTVFGEGKSEEKRLRDEQWAQFKDDNPKGAGNMMNRG
ncbi:TAP42-like protein [Scleroderma yunnanense]